MYRRKPQGWLKHFDFILLDLVCLHLAFVFSYFLRHNWQNPYADAAYRNIIIVLTLIDMVLQYFFELFSGVLRRGYYKEFAATVKHVVMVEVAVSFYLFSVQESHIYSRIMFFLLGIIYVLLSYVVRMLWKNYIMSSKDASGKTSMLIMTARNSMEQVIENVCTRNFETHYTAGLVFLDEDTGTYGEAADDGDAEAYPETTAAREAAASREEAAGKDTSASRNAAEEVGKTSTAQTVRGIKVVADSHTVIDYVCREWVDEVFFSIPQTIPYPEKLINQFMEMGMVVHIELQPSFRSEGKKQVIENIGNCTVMTSSINTITPKQALFKRSVDIIAGVCGCIATGFLCLILGPMIYRKSPGPIFFSQIRVGKNGRKFKMYKFRSMYLDAEERKKELMAQNRVSDGMMFKLDWDPRIIGSERLPDGTVKRGIGNYIRDWSLDEFPQFFNILKGDMSLVGTRPPTVDEWEKYELRHRARLAIKPGLTGMWQVSGRSNITDFEEVVELDTKYISEWSMGLDMRILMKTMKVVFKKEGSM